MTDLISFQLSEYMKSTHWFEIDWQRKLTGEFCCDIGQQTNVDWNALVSNETNTDVRMYTWRIYF